MRVCFSVCWVWFVWFCVVVQMFAHVLCGYLVGFTCSFFLSLWLVSIAVYVLVVCVLACVCVSCYGLSVFYFVCLFGFVCVFLWVSRVMGFACHGSSDHEVSSQN